MAKHVSMVLTLILAACLIQPVSAQSELVLDIVFPVDGPHSFQNDFDHPRAGHTHEATDILAEKMTKVLAAQAGCISYMPIPEPSWGYAIYIRGVDGYSYAYLHLNNDTPGTDDGSGGPENAYAPGLSRGDCVEKGQHIGWVGDSGNAESIASHLHFEIEDEEGNRVNPYFSLLNAVGAASYNPEVERELSQTINMDLQITQAPGLTHCQSNTLIKSLSSDSVYYCGADGRRYVFPNQAIYFSWYKNFDEVITISDEQLAAIPLGKNVTYKPGVRLVKIQTDPKVYAVGHGGLLRWVTSPETAENLYGANWAKQVDDIPEVFFLDYQIGDPVNF